MKRLLLFVLMVGAGLSVVLLLAEDPVDAGDEDGGITSRSGRSGTDVDVFDDQGQRKASVRVGNLQYTVMEFVEELGEERRAYLIEAETGVPTSDGRYLLEKPVITVYDPPTGDWRGELVAERGTVVTGQASGGDLEVRMGDLHAEAYSLEEDVQGEFAMSDGKRAFLEADRLDWDGELVTGPGRVTWWRDDVRLTGIDMTWREPTGLVRYDRDAVIDFTDPSLGPTGTIESPRGLIWNLPLQDEEDDDEDDGMGHGELLGPVTGTFDDGSSLSGDRLVVTADSGALTLIGDAFVEQGGEWRGRADEITVADDGTGRLELVAAHGSARVEQLDAQGAVTAWLTTPAVDQAGGVAVAADPARWMSMGVEGTGVGLRWERALGRITTERDTVLTGVEGDMAGAVLNAPGGLELIVPPEAVDPLREGRGVLRGPVTGTMADGAYVEADRVDLDGPAGSLVLVGDALARRADGATLSGQRLELLPDDAGELTDVSARGDVVYSQPGEGGDLVVSSERLDLTGGVALTDAPVTARQGPQTMTGTGARWDDARRELRVLADAVLDREAETVVDEDGKVEERPGLHLEAERGLRWQAPSDPAVDALQGAGELYGPVRGHTSDGRTLRAQELVVIRGREEQVELHCDARVGMAEHRWLEGDRLDLDLTEGSRRVTSDDPVVFAADTLRGTGIGLFHDEAQGLTRLLSDADLRVVDEAGRQTFALACDGELTWIGPADAEDVLAAGRGEAFDNVVAVDDEGSRFRTDHLEVLGPERLVRLLGPSRVDLITPTGPGELTATEVIELERGLDDELVRVTATGDAAGEYPGKDDLFVFDARTFTLDRRVRSLVFDGPFHVEQRLPDGEIRTLDGDDETRLVALADENDEILSVAGAGRFVIGANEMIVQADTVDWDVPADHLRLAGDCRMLGVMGWIRAPEMEVWPEARRYHIPLPTVALDDGGR